MLTDTKVKQAKSAEKAYKIYDSDGLYIEIATSGSKLWRWKYRFGGKEKRISLGAYPSVTLASARERRDAAKNQLAAGDDPSAIRRSMPADTDITFGHVAEEWYGMYRKVWSETHAETVRRRLDLYLLPAMGDSVISEMEPVDVLSVVRELEGRGINETANRVLGICSMIFRFAVASGKVKSDPCRDLRGALAPAKSGHHAALTTKSGAQAIVRALSAYAGSAVVRAAVWFTALTFVRQSEMRFATWDEINFEEGIWLIPAERMKMRREHIVPLSRQTLDVLKGLKPITGDRPFIFASAKARGKAISENTVRCALRSMGFSNEEMTAHGFRSMASTLLNEMGWRSDVIERQLAHVEGNSVRAAYNRAEYITERREMMQAWADFLESLR